MGDTSDRSVAIRTRPKFSPCFLRRARLQSLHLGNIQPALTDKKLMIEQLTVKHTLLSIVTTTLLIACACTDISKSTADQPLPQLKHDPIDLLTGEHLDSSGRVPPRMDDLSTPSYALMNNQVLWREIAQSSRKALILVKLPGQRRGFFKGQLLINSEQVAQTKAAILAETTGLQELRDDRLDLRMPKTGSGMVFPGFLATIDSYKAMLALRARSDIDYIEPFALIPQTSCGFTPYSSESRPELADGQLSGNSGSDLIPYTFRHLKITTAWNRFAFPGKGVMLAVLDTGTSEQQDQLHSRFTIGAPRHPAMHRLTGGEIQPGDLCAHGTKVAATVAAPRDGRNIVGALWGANLTTIRVVSAPGLAAFTASQVCEGIAMAKGAGAHITMMAFGFLYASDVVGQCISDTFETTSMIFVAAAGTSVPYVIFPASMNREVVAASVVEIAGPTTYKLFGSGIAYGPDVDFVSVMGSNDFPTSGNIGNSSTQEISAFGASSGAVPHIAAVLALAIQSRPDLTRMDIIARVRAASSVNNVSDSTGQPLSPETIGAGIPNAHKAAGGTTQVYLLGPAVVQAGQPFIFQLGADGESPFSYTWRYYLNNNPVVQFTHSVKFPALSTPGNSTVGTFDFSVTAVDLRDNSTFVVYKSVSVTAAPVPPSQTVRRFSSASVVYHNPSCSRGAATTR